MLRFRLLLVAVLFIQIMTAQQTVGLLQNDSTSYNGYTLFAPGSTESTYLIDNCGFVVNSWDASVTNPGVSVYLLENGNLLRTGRIGGNFNGGGTGGRLEIFSWDDELIWRYDYSTDDYHHHHDVAPMPNGNILLIAWERQDDVAVIEAGRNPAMVSGEVWSERIVEIKPVGTNDIEVVWEWRLWDHLIQDFDSTKTNYGVVADHPELMDIHAGVNATGNNKDWIHFNGIDYNPQLDQIAVSSRHLSEIYIIDHSTTTSEAATHTGGNADKGGDFLFRWGNPQSYKRGLPEDKKFYGQHDVRWIPQGYPDEGKIMVFNNGQGRPGGFYSSVDIIEPPLDANNAYTISSGQPFEPLDLYWTYEADPPTSMYSPNISGAHRLPNGNTLICVGRAGEFREVTTDGEVVWKYQMPVGNNGPVSQGTILTNANVFRATRYETDYLAFVGKDLTPTVPIELNPLPSDCEIFGPVSTSAITQLEGVNILNNPFHDFLFIKNQTGEKVIIEVFDGMGRMIKNEISADATIQLSADNWKSGFYVARVYNVTKERFFIQKIIKE